MVFIKATQQDYENLCKFYKSVCEQTPNVSKTVQWKYGIYPTDNDILNYIKKGATYILKQDNNILCVASILPYQTPDYEPVNWQKAYSNNQVAMVHLLGVDPLLQRKSLAKTMLDNLLDLANQWGKKALRLDTLCTNLPAQNLYKNYGFTFCGTQNLYTPNAGKIDFFYYEILL